MGIRDSNIFFELIFGIFGFCKGGVKGVIENSPTRTAYSGMPEIIDGWMEQVDTMGHNF